MKLFGTTWFAALTYALAFWVAFVAVHIEVLNQQAGGVLPIREYVNNDPAQGTVKWRVARGDPIGSQLRRFVRTAGLAQYLLIPLLLLLTGLLLTQRRTSKRIKLHLPLLLLVASLATASAMHRDYFNAVFGGW